MKFYPWSMGCNLWKSFMIIQLRISLATKLSSPGKRGHTSGIADSVLLRKASFCFVWNFFVSFQQKHKHVHENSACILFVFVFTCMISKYMNIPMADDGITQGGIRGLISPVQICATVYFLFTEHPRTATFIPPHTHSLTQHLHTPWSTHDTDLLIFSSVNHLSSC